MAYLTPGGPMSASTASRGRVLSRMRAALRRILLIEHSPFMTL